jgi:NAD(P)-dependent dehydrogenase (short-subunit alcohol dehydrogenase family)
MTEARELRFDGRAAIITGARRGLGRSYALKPPRRRGAVVMSDAGFNMAGDSAGDPALSVDMVREITATGGNAIASQHDVADAVQACALVDQCVDAFGRVDILVHNAGNYGMAKSGVIGLMHAIGLDTARHGIQVNCIASMAMTRLGEALPKTMAKRIHPSEVGGAVTWLCSDRCKLNGEILISGAGHFSRAVTLESRGIDLGAPEVGADAVEREWSGIADMKGALVYDDALQAVSVMFAKLQQRAGLA